MNQPILRRFEIVDATHGAVPCAVLSPSDPRGSSALCLFLYGGSGSRESLADVQPLFAQWWASGCLPPMTIATPDVGPWSFYLDDPSRGFAWETFIVERFIPHLRSELDVATRIAIVGISMGGSGALKIAFAHPNMFDAVAAVSPMIEPAVDANEVPLRNRYHYPPGVPSALLGATRDAALHHRDHPATRARSNVDALRRSELGIYVDAAGADVLHAHDGAEHLHRILWDLDVAHEYRLRRDADHVGPELIERLFDAFAWAGSRIAPPTPATLEEPEWRRQLEPLRREAEKRDPTMSRRYGVLPR